MIFLRLGLIAFGGPIAHLGYFREEFVRRRAWLTERSYTDLVALCQFLPGPASSQVGIALGLSRAGYTGALAAWAGFTLPSAGILILLAQGIVADSHIFSPAILHGLKIVAVAVIAQAVWGMARSLCTTKVHFLILLIACFVALLVPSMWGQLGIITAAALAGLLLFKPMQLDNHDALPVKVSHHVGVICLAVFFIFLIGLPLLTQIIPGQTMRIVDVFYRAGSLVFGGGHVVLPILHSQLVIPGWVNNETFLIGYAVAQAVPGPLFSFAAFLGASMYTHKLGWLGGVISLIAIFLPSFLLVIGTLPFWEKLRHNIRAQAALSGINAAVIGLLLATLYHPVWTTTIHQLQDFGLALFCLIALIVWKWPPLLVVLGAVAGGLVASPNIQQFLHL